MSVSDDPLFRDPDFASFYDIQNGDEAESGRNDFAFCRSLAEEAGSILDLGCGTGELTASLAPSRRVVGVDPADAMLEIARNRPGGDKVRWLEADARTVRLSETFDLVLLTGHAFQVFLNDDDVLAVLKTIAAHLSPNGRFIFDTRNPLRQEWRQWTPETSLATIVHPIHGSVKSWHDVAFDERTGISTYQTFYEMPDAGKTLAATSQIRFIGRDRLSALIAEAELKVDRWLGDWGGALWERVSKEIIPIGRLA